MSDAALKRGGPWLVDYEQVHADGYQEDFGHQDATARLGPTCDGVARAEGLIRVGGALSGRAGMIHNQEDNFR